jgi:hypothetical protein
MMLIHLFLKNLYAIYPIYPNVSQVSLGVGIVFRPSRSKARVNFFKKIKTTSF